MGMSSAGTRRSRFVSAAACVLAFCFAAGSASAQETAVYRVTFEPAYLPENSARIYAPLLRYLQAETGHRFTAVTPRNFQFHWRDLRQNATTDFVFEEAHFADYRIQRFGYRPLARLAEPSSYSIIALPETAEAGLNGLVGRRLITMTSPSLGYALLGELFRNPLSQPDIRSEATSWRDGVEMIFADETEAAIVPRYIADLYPNLQEITRSREFPGAAFLVGPQVPEEVATAVRDALLRLHENPDASMVLQEIGSRRFEPASAAELEGSEQMLREFFGYQ
ncbi:MAG: phosphate/phosphite/phosphonate ABC transporter substrate-binding protein [Aquimonas sp.]|nr:phosphate/phosphite/phosphonate ABC transporter substrate-binding protein [Aquimonas sp.]